MTETPVLEEDLNFDNICRLCLASNRGLSNIFKYETLPCAPEWTLVDKILDCTSLQVLEGDSLPCQICPDCCTLVEALHNFKRRCLSCDETLRNFLQKQDLDIEVKSEHDELITKDADTGNPTKEKETEFEPEIIPTCGSPSPDTDWKCKAVDVEVKVEIAEPSEENPAPHKKPQDNQPTISNSDNHATKPPVKARPSGIYRIDSLEKNSPLPKINLEREKSLAKKPRRMSMLKDAYPCSQCKKVFAHKNSLTRHEVSHTNEKFTCMFCNKTLSTRETLIRHVKAHQGDKRYQCMHCGKKYTSSTSYSTHIRKHTGERPYHCPECDASFSLPSSLERHLAKHGGTKDFVCDLCSASFWVYDDLRCHVNRVH